MCSTCRKAAARCRSGHVIDDRRTVAEQQPQHTGIAGELGGGLQPVAEAVKRVGAAGFQDHAEQARQHRRGEKSRGDIAEKRDRGADGDHADRLLIVVADIFPIAVEQQRQRDDNGKQPDQLDRFEEEAPDVGRVLVAHLAIVRRGRHGRRAMPW